MLGFYFFNHLLRFRSPTGNGTNQQKNIWSWWQSCCHLSTSKYSINRKAIQPFVLKLHGYCFTCARFSGSKSSLSYLIQKQQQKAAKQWLLSEHIQVTFRFITNNEVSSITPKLVIVPCWKVVTCFRAFHFYVWQDIRICPNYSWVSSNCICYRKKHRVQIMDKWDIIHFACSLIFFF